MRPGEDRLLAISIRNKDGFLNGRVQKPAEDDLLYTFWKRCNDLIVSWLLKSISPSIASTIFYMTDAAQIWQKLANLFAQADGVHISYLQQQLSATIQGSRTVDEYFSDLNAIWQELCQFRPAPHCTCARRNPNCFNCNTEDVVASLNQMINMLPPPVQLEISGFRSVENVIASFNQIVSMRPPPSQVELGKILGALVRMKLHSTAI
ncbi:hypothetical protein L6164_001080 [Bauhinia variegata]|uniref:Uncharacterized protein n=1 Tax=Bauhinia variegata TaxID=167791 RepID=A0ACB9Q8M3_BAUVA|nr:hypothetical protein L6164_001080 [Bauhinia variegata]